MKKTRVLRFPALILAVLTTLVVGLPASAATTARYTFAGKAFDTCEAPSVSTMQAWLSSPFRAVGIYVGGANRSCAQPNLTASWVMSVRTQGWSMLPIYVGRQAPCTRFKSLISPGAAATQGVSAADDAIAKTGALGIGSRNPIYLNIEAYPRTSAGCSAAVKKYVSSWTARISSRGYVPGVYGSTASLMVDLVSWRADASFHRPAAIWYARWDGRAAVFGEPTIPNGDWATHQRVHQYKGPGTRTYGGRSLNIDINQVDAPAVRPAA